MIKIYFFLRFFYFGKIFFLLIFLLFKKCINFFSHSFSILIKKKLSIINYPLSIGKKVLSLHLWIKIYTL